MNSGCVVFANPMRGNLPPVRRPVPLGWRTRGEPLDAAFAGYAVRIYNSGTEALAMAIADARLRSGATAPEVILPAYGCPDLVAASLFAGVRPRLVDTASGQWGYDLDSLAKTVSTNTVAIVAVNLLGVGDQALELRAIATANGLALIQDSAQYLPQSLPITWLGDYVVFSFGRGKPLNLLHGGALLHSPERGAAATWEQTHPLASQKESALLRWFAGLAFNVVTHPSIYGISRRLAGSLVGGTSYKPLNAAYAPSAWMIRFVETGLASYRVNAGYDATVWADACAAWSSRGVELLLCASRGAGGVPRLRLALLAHNRRIREAIVTVLERRGLGASRMYGASLDGIAGVPTDVASQGPFPNARSLAERLFTLPTHSLVSPASVQMTQETVAGVLAQVD